MDVPSVSVVIPTYNRRDQVVEAVRAVMEDDAATEIIVVIDGSDDGTHTALTALDPTAVRLHPVVLPENMGRSVARKTGVDQARGDVVLLLDDDVVARPGLVQGHARRHAAASKPTVVLGYMPVLADRKRKGFASVLYAQEYEGVCRRYERDASTVLTSLWGGNFSLPRKQCIEVGLLADGFEDRYHEDTDFGLRCRDAGLVGVFDRTLRADHHHQRSLQGFLRDAYERGAGIELLRQRHGTVVASALPPHPILGNRIVVAAADAILGTAAKVHPAVELLAARGLRKLHMYRGALDIQR